MTDALRIVIIGLSITSSWGNGHATTYRSLVKGLRARGHRVQFLEKDQPWYAAHRDRPQLDYCDVRLYRDLADLRERFTAAVTGADVVIVGSYVDDGRDVCHWVLAEARGARMFYDIDTPVTLASLEDDSCAYLAADDIPAFDAVLSFTGGQALRQLSSVHGARQAHALYCSVDVDDYRPLQRTLDIDLGYMGTYSADRQPGLDALLLRPAERMQSCSFAVAGALYPDAIEWPRNVRRIDHLPPHRHPDFYARQRFTLNLTRASMRAAGHSPSVRLFEAASCGTAIISDAWPGLEDVFAPGEQIVIAHSGDDVIDALTHLDSGERSRMATAARERVLAEHSGLHRAAQLEQCLLMATGQDRTAKRVRSQEEVA